MWRKEFLDFRGFRVWGDSLGWGAGSGVEVFASIFCGCGGRVNIIQDLWISVLGMGSEPRDPNRRRVRFWTTPVSSGCGFG